MLTLAIDQGTTSTRAILFDSDYTACAKSQHPVRLSSPHRGWAEQDADEIVASVCKCIADVGGLDGSRIGAIGLTNQRESTVAWSRSTGAALCPVITWMDTRTSSMLGSYELPLVKELTGLPMSTYFSALKMRWMLDNCAQVRQKAEEDDLVFGTIDSWLLFRLAGQSGGRLFVTDPTNASRTMLMHLTAKQWDERLLRHFGIRRAWLCEITESSFGSIGGVPVKAVLGDQHAALYGHGGKTKCTYGTGCFVVAEAGLEPARRSSLVSTLAYGDRFALEAPIASAGSAVDWVVRLLGIADSKALCDLALEGRGSEVHFIPALTGLLAPVWNAEARGSLHNLVLSTTAADIARSALHAVAFSVALVLEEMPAGEDDCLVVDGGLSASDLLMQIQADVLRRPVHRPRSVEFTALGVAMYANSDTASCLTIDSDIFTPRNDLATAFAAWKRLFFAAGAHTGKTP